MKKILLGALGVLCGLFSSACSPKVEFAIDSADTLKLTVHSATTADGADLLSALSGLWGGGKLFNEAALQQAFQDNGFTTVRAQSGDGFSFRVDAVSRSVAALLARKTGLGNACTLQPGLFELALSPETVAGIVSMLPEETSDYKDLFLAPVFTGEASTKDAYLELIAAVYGQAFAAALDKSTLTVAFTAPGTVKSTEAPPWVGSRNVSQKTVAWTMPLALLLTKQERSVWRITW